MKDSCRSSVPGVVCNRGRFGAQCRQSLPFVNVWQAWYSKWDIIISRCLVTSHIPPKKIPGWFCRISEALVTDSDPMDVLEAGFPVPWKRWLWFSRTSPKKSPDSACFAARSCFTTPSQRAFKTGRDQWQGRSQRNAMYRSCKICKMPVLSSLQPVNPSYLYKLNIYNYIYITICIYIWIIQYPHWNPLVNHHRQGGEGGPSAEFFLRPGGTSAERARGRAALWDRWGTKEPTFQGEVGENPGIL